MTFTRLKQCILWTVALATATSATILESQVVVVYNAASVDATALRDAYLAAHPGIPATNVCALNETSLVGVADVSYVDFITLIRNPIRTWFNLPTSPNPEDIIAIVLLRPFPHRVLDTDNPSVGDNPPGQGGEFDAGDVTNASVDAELALLWQDLELGLLGSVEAGGRLDSFSDNVIENPYHEAQSPIDIFPRNNITQTKAFRRLSNGMVNIAWATSTAANRLRPGEFYCVCRLDGNSAADALALISRAGQARVARPFTRIILDEYDLSSGADLDDDGFFAAGRDDYEFARDNLIADGWDVLYDDAFSFVAGSDLPLVAYASYGENHSLGGNGENPAGNGIYIESFEFTRGAIFNTIESYNGRAFNGLGTLFNQEQASDFIATGGTFAIGSVWEPFSNFATDNEYLLTYMLRDGWMFAEAAYASIPALSWQTIMIGDPLGRIRVLGDLNADRSVLRDDAIALLECSTGPDNSSPAGCELADLDFDDDIDSADVWLLGQLMGR